MMARTAPQSMRTRSVCASGTSTVVMRGPRPADRRRERRRVGRRRWSPGPRWRSTRPRGSGPGGRRRRRVSPAVTHAATTTGTSSRAVVNTRAPRSVAVASWTLGRASREATSGGAAGAPRSRRTSKRDQSSAARSSAVPNACITPRKSTAMRLASLPASPRKWVHSTTVRPWSAASDPMRSTTSRVAAGSSPEVGSSRNSSSGSWSSARASATRLRWPVENPCTFTSARWPMSKRSSRAPPFARASASDMPRSRPTNSRFSSAVNRSSSPAFSVSTPVRRRSSSPWAHGSRPSTVARPESASSTPLSRRMVVVLPAPLGPSRASTSPRFTSSVRESRAMPDGNERVRPSQSITRSGSPIGSVCHRVERTRIGRAPGWCAPLVGGPGSGPECHHLEVSVNLAAIIDPHPDDAPALISRGAHHHLRGAPPAGGFACGAGSSASASIPAIASASSAPTTGTSWPLTSRCSAPARSPCR